MADEAWMEGTIEGVSLLLMPAAHALVQAVRDIAQAADGLTIEEVWVKPNGAASVGFHLRHVAGSVDRLLTYARGENLTPEQFAELAAEGDVDVSLSQVTPLVVATTARIDEALTMIKAVPDSMLFDSRTVGRERLPTNVFGLLFHIAEHTMRHAGQIVTTARIVRVQKASAKET